MTTPSDDQILLVHAYMDGELDPAHALDVERRTVTRWFDGRIPEAPRVVDLSGDGCPLAGGRLDVVARVPVATLVCRHRQHVVSLTEVPARGRADAAPVRRTNDGYNLVGWT